MIAAVRGNAPKRAEILMLVDVFDDEHGGTEQHLLFLLRELLQYSFGVHFAAFSEFHCHDPKLFAVEPVILSEGCRPGLRGSVTRLRRLAAMISSKKIDVVHTFSQTAELAALLATRLAGRGKVLGIRRNIGYQHTSRTLWLARAMRFLGARYVANCKAAEDFYTAAEWLPRRRFSVIPNPVASKRLEAGLRNVSQASSLGIREGENVVCMVAEVRKIKDHATFFRAARLVLEEHPRTRFLVAGSQEPETYAELQTLVHTLGIEDQVSWLGAVPNPYSFLPHCDVGVLSSLSEAFSNALLEYAAAGVAAVATDVGGTKEVIEDAETGFIVPPRSPEQMAERICQLLQDEKLRKRLGENARRRAETRFAEEKILRQYSRLYLRLA